MTHWKDIPDYPVPEEGSFDRPAYDELMATDDMKRIVWNLHCALSETQWKALDLAQDLSFDFEMLDYTNVKEEFRHKESLERQERGVEYMYRAYELAGFSKERRDGIKQVARQIAERF